MRLFNRTEFLKLPSATIFCAGPEFAFGNLRVKGETLASNDFICQEVQWIDSHDSGEAVDRLERMLQLGESYPMNADYGRDGCFDDAEVYLVWEAADLVKLIEYCQVAIEVARTQ